MKTLFLTVLLVFSASAALAQEHAKIEAGANYNYFRTDNHSVGTAQRTGGNLNGWSGHFTYYPTEYYGITADVGGAYGTVEYRGSNFGVPVRTRIHTFLFGPQARLGEGKLSLIANGKVGFARIDRETGQLDDYDHGLAFSVGGAADWKLTKSLSVRPIQVDFVGTRFDRAKLGSDTQYNFRLGAGLVFRR